MLTFDEWAAPTLDISLGGHTYKIPGPTVAHEPIVRAVVAARYAAIVGEPLPDEVQAVLDRSAGQSLAELVLGPDVLAQMEDDHVPAATVNRISTYAADWWEHGERYADTVASALWAGPKPDPKAQTTKKPTRARKAKTSGSKPQPPTVSEK
jgi:hypothetical protein